MIYDRLFNIYFEECCKDKDVEAIKQEKGILKKVWLFLTLLIDDFLKLTWICKIILVGMISSYLALAFCSSTKIKLYAFLILMVLAAVSFPQTVHIKRRNNSKVLEEHFVQVLPAFRKTLKTFHLYNVPELKWLIEKSQKEAVGKELLSFIKNIFIVLVPVVVMPVSTWVVQQPKEHIATGIVGVIILAFFTGYSIYGFYISDSRRIRKKEFEEDMRYLLAELENATSKSQPT